MDVSFNNLFEHSLDLLVGDRALEQDTANQIAVPEPDLAAQSVSDDSLQHEQDKRFSREGRYYDCNDHERFGYSSEAAT